MEWDARYSTVEKQCLAIWWAGDSLCYYLLGHLFTLWSYHAPLQRDANARITWWHLALQPFKFKVVQRPGAQMVMADFIRVVYVCVYVCFWGGCRPDVSPA